MLRDTTTVTKVVQYRHFKLGEGACACVRALACVVCVCVCVCACVLYNIEKLVGH